MLRQETTAPIVNNSSEVQNEKPVTFSDVIAEVEKRFQIEKDCKNMAYAFIMQNGLLERFQQFSITFTNEDPHKMTIQTIISKI